jgi:hypothetical protein
MEEQESNKFSRIDKITAVFMVVVALFYGFSEFLVDFVPYAGQVVAFIIDLFATMHFALWFTLRGVKLGSPKTVARFWLPVLFGWLPIPVLDSVLLPIGVILTIGITWFEDKTGVNINKVKSKLKPKKGLRTKKRRGAPNKRRDLENDDTRPENQNSSINKNLDLNTNNIQGIKPPKSV